MKKRNILLFTRCILLFASLSCMSGLPGMAQIDASGTATAYQDRVQRGSRSGKMRVSGMVYPFPWLIKLYPKGSKPILCRDYWAHVPLKDQKTLSHGSAKNFIRYIDRRAHAKMLITPKL